MTPTFHLKILSYYQNENVYKKNRPKNINFWTNGEQFCAISYLAQFWPFLSKFLHVISNYTYQQVTNSNGGSNMATLMVSSMGATESDMPWEVVLSMLRK